jgi:hypothetical protein
MDSTEISGFRGRDRPDDGGSKHLWNVGKLLPHYIHGAKTQKTVTFNGLNCTLNLKL